MSKKKRMISVFVDKFRPFVLIGGLVLAMTFLANQLLAFRVNSPESAWSGSVPDGAPPTEVISGEPINPSQEWKTYSDDEYGFSIQHPAAFVVTDSEVSSDPNQARVVLFQSTETPEYFSTLASKPDRIGVAALIVEKRTSQTLLEGFSESGHGNIRSIYPIKINDLDAIQLEVDGQIWDYRLEKSTTEARMIIIIPRSDHSLVLSFTPKPLNVDNSTDYSDVMAKMLASLSFR